MQIVYDEDGNILQNDTLDFTKGYLVKKIVVKKDALPIDNIGKFAWDNTDYEEINVFIKYSADRLDDISKLDPNAKIAIMERRLATLETELIKTV